MKTGSRGMGMAKHGKSGRPPKSPKLRHAIKREAEKNEIKSRKPLSHKNVKGLFK